MVALRKESVDRNIQSPAVIVKMSMSLSVRRAWIEMTYSGGVVSGSGSLSVRRAWIEINYNTQ